MPGCMKRDSKRYMSDSHFYQGDAISLSILEDKYKLSTTEYQVFLIYYLCP